MKFFFLLLIFFFLYLFFWVLFLYFSHKKWAITQCYYVKHPSLFPNWLNELWSVKWKVKYIYIYNLHMPQSAVQQQQLIFQDKNYKNKRLKLWKRYQEIHPSTCICVTVCSITAYHMSRQTLCLSGVLPKTECDQARVWYGMHMQSECKAKCKKTYLMRVYTVWTGVSPVTHRQMSTNGSSS